MRKIFLFATAVAATALASCNKNADPGTDPGLPETIHADGPQVQLTFGTDAATRAFFDQSAAAETWETYLYNLAVHVFDQSGKRVLWHDMTMDEIDRKSARISLPHSVAGTACSIYVVGNHTGSGWGSTPAELDNLRLNYLGSTNGTFEVLNRGAREITSFVMTGKAVVTIAGKDSYTPVNVALRRMTAKVAVRTTVDNAFKTKMNGGNLVVTSARIHNVPQQTYAFYRADFAGTPVEKSYVFTQEPGVNGEFYENLFYIHESGPAAAGDRVKLTLSGYFDTDGDPATTDDRTDAIYHVEINGSGGGEIKRNGYYRVNVLLKGLPGDGAVVTCTTADWEAPVTQNSSAGV